MPDLSATDNLILAARNVVKNFRDPGGTIEAFMDCLDALDLALIAVERQQQPTPTPASQILAPVAEVPALAPGEAASLISDVAAQLGLNHPKVES